MAMRLEVKEQIKTLLAQRGMKLKDLASSLGCAPNSLSQRIGRASITYNEMLQIAEILGYKIEFIDKEIL